MTEKEKKAYAKMLKDFVKQVDEFRADGMAAHIANARVQCFGMKLNAIRTMIQLADVGPVADTETE